MGSYPPVMSGGPPAKYPLHDVRRARGGTMTNLTPVMSGRPAEYPLHEVWRARGWILGIHTPHDVWGAPRKSPPMMSGGAAGGIPKSKSPRTQIGLGSPVLGPQTQEPQSWVRKPERVPTFSKKTKNSADSVEGERGGADEEIKDKDKAAAG
jgi:hypothetical protein